MKYRIMYSPIEPNWENLPEGKEPDTILESGLIPNKNGNNYKVRLNLTKMIFEVIAVGEYSRVVRRSKRPVNNLNVLKRNARKALTTILDLKREMRNRTFGLCTKGYTQKEHLRVTGTIKEDI